MYVCIVCIVCMYVSAYQLICVVYWGVVPTLLAGIPPAIEHSSGHHLGNFSEIWSDHIQWPNRHYNPRE